MNKFKLIILLIIAFLLGDAQAVARSNARIRKIQARHKRDLWVAKTAAFHRGLTSVPPIEKQPLFDEHRTNLNRFNILKYPNQN